MDSDSAGMLLAIIFWTGLVAAVCAFSPILAIFIAIPVGGYYLR